ncbi:hypothetical protein EZJ49_02360 [Bdellovibrio bacteriovorus]|uniref:hypothetical protein n=1 Tax=Bdellovibrio bacteriovorus TaxID=959 RepID=UPI0021D3A951|nr:hypothetical protein [Bdellovibrio bacteriovorus]UXR65089.1 hypothetical protein EZJ49_02360 [Bdellovibrio bacteriovorus]
MTKKRILMLGLLLLPAFAEAQSNSRWRITKPSWTAVDEQRFGEFVSQIGGAVERRECDKVDTCLRSSANPYAGTDPSNLRLFADCADLPYYLRGYFAWKNGLPMSVVSSVSARPGNTNKDVRYSTMGNYVTGRYDVIPSRTSSPNAVSLLNSTLIDMTYSATFRMIGQEDTGRFTDFYPVKLSRETIRPGTVIYDPNGHVAIIYKVTDDGRIFYIDSHPDNTLTSGMYTPKFSRSHPQHGAGFKNFRPLSLQGAQRNSAGDYYGGKIIGARNDQLAAYSLEQFYGNSPDPEGVWNKGKFLFRGVAFPYYDYLRIMMASGELRIDPIKDMQQVLADICVNLKDRVVAVEQARKAGVDMKPHPERLPTNIYGTVGEWEDYASPSRDARLKVSFMDILNQSRNLVQRHRAGDPAIVYSGANLAADLLATYQREAAACQFTYVNSSGSPVTLNLEEGRQRVFAMSFDPYHCVELRWGASNPQELASCRDDENKRLWYDREKWLRYQWERRYDSRMDYSLDELTGPKPGAGIAQPPDVDIIRLLNSLM